MSGHHPFQALAETLTATSEGRAAVDQWRRQLDSVVSLSRPPTAADHTRAEALSGLLTPQPEDDWSALGNPATELTSTISHPPTESRHLWSAWTPVWSAWIPVWSAWIPVEIGGKYSFRGHF